MKNSNVIKLSPSFKELIWGGTKLRSYFGFDTPGANTAEALVLSCRDNAECVDSKGTPLSEIYASRPGFFGSNCAKYDRFPHPDDEYAAEVSDDWGKAQLWYVIDCEPGAYLICGFNDELTIEDFRRRIEDDTLISAVNTYEVRKGDTFYIEPGTLHAIGKDILLAEIGQNSELSYRVYDYCRVDENGGSRPLNIQQALDVTITAPPTVPAGAMAPTAEIDYFASSLWEVEKNALISAPDESFISLLMLEGTLKIDGLDVTARKGDSVLIAAGSKDVPLSGTAKFIATVVE